MRDSGSAPGEDLVEALGQVLLDLVGVAVVVAGVAHARRPRVERGHHARVLLEAHVAGVDVGARELLGGEGLLRSAAGAASGAREVLVLEGAREGDVGAVAPQGAGVRRLVGGRQRAQEGDVLPALAELGHRVVELVQRSSMGGRFSLAGVGPYSATKFALEGLSEALALEVAPHGIKVLTPSRASSTPPGRSS